jgi:hypothetical protein
LSLTTVQSLPEEVLTDLYRPYMKLFTNGGNFETAGFLCKVLEVGVPLKKSEGDGGILAALLAEGDARAT